MIQERITLSFGKKPVIYVAPHGCNCDDLNTGIIVNEMASMTDGYAVVNNGWEKADKIDYKNEKANCNNVEHCHADVIKEEFLDPLIRFKNKILKKWSRVLIVYIHGASNEIRSKNQISDLNYVIGYGNGHPVSYTCQKWVKDFLVYHLTIADNCTVAVGKSGGNYAAWSKRNMAQLFRKHYKDDEVDTIQIEVVNEIRNTAKKAKTTAQIMSMCFNEILNKESWEMPKNFIIKSV
jgi:hypothetical protein